MQTSPGRHVREMQIPPQAATVDVADRITVVRNVSAPEYLGREKEIPWYCQRSDLTDVLTIQARALLMLRSRRARHFVSLDRSAY